MPSLTLFDVNPVDVNEQSINALQLGIMTDGGQAKLRIGLPLEP